MQPTTQGLPAPASSTRSPRHSRLESAALLDELRAVRAQGRSERAFFRDAPIARSTLRDEADRVERAAAEGAEAATFYSSAPGQMQLMRIVLAAHFVMTLLGCCGLRAVCTFLRLAGLSPFVGTSIGAQQRLNAWLQEQVAAFGREEQQRLGTTMSARTLWLCEDETFFPQMVLVAIEALSDYVLVERVAEHRDAATWSAAVKEQLAGLPVEVAGVTADGAKGIAAHVQQSLGLTVTPDIFHVQHEVQKVTSAALQSRVRAAEEQLQEVRQRGGDEEAAVEKLAEARAQQQRMAAAIEGLGEASRPYDERSGEVRRKRQVESDLSEMLNEAEAVARRAGLSEASHAGIGKARRAIEAIAASIEGYHERVALSLSALHLPEDIELAMRDQVLPALYLRRIAEQSRDAESKRRLCERAKALVAPLSDEAQSPMMHLSEAAVADLLRQGESWVALHVRSSSCVEGRNGQLELHHHGLRGLSDAKLAALTAVHNFWTRRADGTTAAERFFGQQPRDMFESLLDLMPDLPRPARKRPRAALPSLLN